MAALFASVLGALVIEADEGTPIEDGTPCGDRDPADRQASPGSMLDGLIARCRSELLEIAPPSTGDLVTDLTRYAADLCDVGRINPHCRGLLSLTTAEGQPLPPSVGLHLADVLRSILERVQTRLAMAEAKQERPGMSDLAKTIPLPFGPPRAVPSLDGGERMGGTAGPRHEARPAGWGAWHRAPDPREGGMLTAPLGPGLYEFQLVSGEPILLGSAKSVAARIATLLPKQISSRLRSSHSRRHFLMRNIDRLEYRTRTCETYAQARQLAEGIDQRRYRLRVDQRLTAAKED